jgi:5-methylcytosine-specific restriction endonuclease McrA
MDSKSSKLLHKTKRKVRSEEYLKYQRYIRSKEFKAIREQVLLRDNYHCQTCNWCVEEGGNRSLSVHHKRYDNLYEEQDHLEDLITLCSVCHKAIHSAVSNYQRFNKKEKEGK